VVEERIDGGTATLDAVHDDDLDEFLESVGELGRVNRGEAKCAFCRDVITRDNLNAIFPDSGMVKYSCTRPVCVMRLFEAVGDPAHH